MNTKYKGSTPIKARQWVELTTDGEPWAKVCVIDTLASQFTVKVNGTVRFFFYVDEGLTWRKANEKTDM